MASNINESLLKATFIYNFLRHGEWPEAAQTSPIKICTIGDDPILEKLNLIREKKQKTISFLVQNKPPNSNLMGCSIVFISKNFKGNILPILNRIESSPILTVSDLDNFVPKGGIIGMTTDESKINLQLNIISLKKTKVKIPPELMGMMDIFPK